METHETIIRGPETLPYGLYSCPICGAGGLARVVGHIWRGTNNPMLEFRFCPGNRQPTEMRPVDSAPVFMFGPDGVKAEQPEEEVQMECAGIITSHFHIQCRRCHASWLMDTLPVTRKKQAKRRKWSLKIMIGFLAYVALAGMVLGRVLEIIVRLIRTH